jgi:hypothetical protein
LNLAVPSLMMSEPGDPIKTKIMEGIEVTLWDRWEYQGDHDTSLQEVIVDLEERFKGL